MAECYEKIDIIGSHEKYRTIAGIVQSANVLAKEVVNVYDVNSK